MNSANIRQTNRRSNIGRQPWYRQLRWGDFLLYGLIASLAIILFLAAPKGLSGQSNVALLTEDGKVIFQKPVSELQAAGSFEIEAQEYHYIIAYEDGKIRFAEADCPDKVCVRSGWVYRPGQVAACVPGHLILKITGPVGTNPDDVDIVLQ